MSDKLKNIFAHTDCISEEILLKYLSDTLSAAEKHKVEKHLIDCEMCSDAVEGLSMMVSSLLPKESDGLIRESFRTSTKEREQKIHSVVAGLNEQIQERVRKKKEVKVIFLRQYRTHLAVAASIVLVLGLVWFFRTNMQMKEMDSVSAEKMFAEKFSPPPSDLDNETTTGKEQTGPEVNHPVATAQEPPLPSPSNVTLGEAEKKVVPSEESPSFVTVEGANAGKDIADEKHLGWPEKQSRKLEDIPAQKGEQLQQDVIVLKIEEKEEDNFYRYKGAETTPKGNVAAKSEVTSRDEDIVLLTKEVSKNQNELESLKEKDKKADETKKPQSTATGATAGLPNQPIQDKSATLVMQDNKKTADGRERTDENKVNRAQSGEGDVFALASGKKAKEEKSGGKGKKAKAPQKVSGGYFDAQTTVSAPMPETPSQAKSTETESREKISGKLLGSVAVGGTVESTIVTDETVATDSTMIKYDKQDYGGAVKDFELKLKQNPNDEKALFYSAVSYLSLGQADKAITNFNKILENKNGKYYDDAQWYISLAYIKKKDAQNAGRNLMDLRSNARSKYQKQADETLREMNK